MTWLQLTITNLTRQQAEYLSDALEEVGALSTTFQDAKDTPIFEPLPGETKLWGEINLIALFEANTVKSPIEHRITQYMKSTDTYALHWEELADKDWSRVWMEDFHPMQFGKKLWIYPSWYESIDPSTINVVLDPGLAFGSGTHPTTALCLQWLDGHDLTGKNVIDFGCGSGILGIAAMKLGAKSVMGIDIDPQAIEASQDNAKRNGITSNLSFYLSQHIDLTQCSADIVVANILAGPLQELAPQLTQLVAPKGWLVLSGILAEQAEQIRKAYQTNFKLEATVIDGDWCRITGQKNSK